MTEYKSLKEELTYNPFIRTIKERCRVCYTCVRECPVKAIRITGGQAEVLPGHCIGCGNCTSVCNQDAKQYPISIGRVYKLLEGGNKTAACVAPSFVSDFYDIEYQRFVGMLRSLGFDYVNEVAFGADLTARKTVELIQQNPKNQYIESSCPSVTEYVKCYHPDLVGHLAPLVSPMIATGRVLKHIYGQDLKCVFIGPCIAKKFEAMSGELSSEIEDVLTFKELRQIFKEKGITPANAIPGEFDPPLAGKGALFPLSHGMNQSVELFEDLTNGNIVAADGRENFIDAIKALESGDLDTNLLELLCCRGCIMGPGMSVEDSLFKRRSRVSKYVRKLISKRDKEVWLSEIEKYEKIDFSRHFEPNDQRIPDPNESVIKQILARMGKFNLQDELNCGACGYETCREHAIAVIKGFAEDEMCLPYTIEKLHKTVRDLGITGEQLANTREALMQSEKLASMGQLSAGIAHELNNPLGVVLLYANLVLDEIDEQSNFKDDLMIIANEANRCKKIVAGLLNFARENKVVLNMTNVCEMVDQCVAVTPVPDNINVNLVHNLDNTDAMLDRDQIIQVLNNLITNSVTAMPDGGDITIKTSGDDNFINLIVSDSGCGISDQNLRKIFEPFFTTKTIGKGTGLGLAVTYGIIKMHKGNIKVESNADPKKGKTGTTFTINLPRNNGNGLSN
jgi:signal transduction histidine kinase/iron only hydrogenase large subunit-like protein